MDRVVVPSAARVAADSLREEILDLPEGSWLGSEDDVLARLGVSRPTLRQAARLLEGEQLLVVKRGLKGGLFARKPTAEGVAHIASVFLRSEGTSIADLARSFYIIQEQVVRMAVANPDVEARAALAAWVEEHDRDGLLEDRRAFARARIEFTRQVAKLSGSAVLTLFLDVLWELGRGRPGLYMEPAEVAATRAYWRRLATAIRDGKERRALTISRDHAEAVLAWVDEHRGDQWEL